MASDDPNEVIRQAEEAKRQAQERLTIEHTPHGDVYKDPKMRVKHLRSLLGAGSKLQDHEVEWLVATLEKQLGG